MFVFQSFALKETKIPLGKSTAEALRTYVFDSYGAAGKTKPSYDLFAGLENKKSVSPKEIAKIGAGLYDYKFIQNEIRDFFDSKYAIRNDPKSLKPTECVLPNGQEVKSFYDTLIKPELVSAPKKAAPNAFR